MSTFFWIINQLLKEEDMKLLTLFLFGVIFCSHMVFCTDAGIVVSVSEGKNLYMNKTKDGKRILLKEKMLVQLDHYIQTGKNTEAVIKLDYQGMNTTIKLRENSQIKIVNKINNNKKRNGVYLFFGRLFSHFQKKGKNSYAVETLNSVAGVEGTEFEVKYTMKSDQTILKVSSGKVRFTRKKSFAGIPQIKMVFPDQISVIEKGKSIKLFKTSTSDNFKKYQKFLNVSAVHGLPENKIVKIEDQIESESVLLNPDEKNEFLIDENNVVSLNLKLMCKHNENSEQYMLSSAGAYVWLDDCNYYMGEKMLFERGRYKKIIKISRDIHNVTLLCGGYQFDTTIDLTDVPVDFKETVEREIQIIRIKIEVFANRNGKKIKLQPDEIVADIDVTVNGQKMKLIHANPKTGIDPILTCVNPLRRKLNLFLPASEKNYIVNFKSKKYKEHELHFNIDEMDDLKKVVLEEK